jgi:hypothetical protein
VGSDADTQFRMLILILLACVCDGVVYIAGHGNPAGAHDDGDGARLDALLSNVLIESPQL